MVSKRSATGGQGFSAQPSRGFNIQDFRAFRDQQGILRNHDFHVEIPWPPGLMRQPALTETHRNLELVCEACNFPATSLATYMVQRYSYGVMEKKPTIPQFGSLDCVFLVDQYSNVWKFFHDWLQVAVNYDFGPNAVTGGQMEVYEISYSHEYTVDFYLYIYNPFGELVRKVAFRQAYPAVVQDAQLAWAAGNQLVRIGVSFNFFDWSEEAAIPTTGGGVTAAQGGAIVK